MLIEEHYFELGRSVDEIASKESLTREHIISYLREIGLAIHTEAERDVATTAILDKGFGSFQNYTRQIGLRSIKDQARDLGVSSGSLTRAHTTFRNYLFTKLSPDRG